MDSNLLCPTCAWFYWLTGFFSFKVDDIPGPEALKFPGKRDGMTKMIREGNTISIHSWSQGLTFFDYKHLMAIYQSCELII